MQERPFDPFLPPTDEVEVSPTEAPGGSPDAPAPSLLERSAVRIPLLVLGFMASLGALVLVFGQYNLQAASEGSTDPTESDALPVLAFDPAAPYTFKGLDIHPDEMFAEYFGGAFLSGPGSDSISASNRDFRYRLGMYESAYGVDDNFSIRVLDERTGETLEVFTLRDLKAQYEASGSIDWNHVDFPGRRDATRRLIDKWAAQGVPRDAVTIRWGRANQTAEARERDENYIQYEIQLARRLGLSLLATEIGTVETFNQDHLISTAGARSRFQMMPDILSTFNVERYGIPTVSGSTVEVAEELHPLLGMEPSLMLVRAYSNAVGHELPGVSAYHTGPGNLFHLYQAYLRANAARLDDQVHVSDAYMWGVTTGFERVRAQSSFGPESRAYVMKAYGALRATENKVINPAHTVKVDRVQIKPGATITLSRLLTALSESDSRLEWGPTAPDSLSLYERFRRLNPHIQLPRSTGDAVPGSGDLRLTATAADGDPVRFFLPPGSADVLRRIGLDVIGEVFPFDNSTYLVHPDEVTAADRAYDDLIRDIGQFGFSIDNKRRLDRLVDQFDALAAQNPDSRYRQTQAKIARIHRGVWNTRGFRDLAGTVETLLTIMPQRRALEAQASESTRVDG